MQDKAATGWDVVRRRAIILVPLIVIVSLLWVWVVLFANPPVIVLIVLGVLSVLLLSVATAWTVVAAPPRKAE